MGWMKDRKLQQDEQGWSFTYDQYVCSSCVDDRVLAEAIDEASTSEENCNFCGRAPSADLNVLLESFVDGLKSEYGDADDEGVSYETAEGGYQWHNKWDTWDLVTDQFSDVLVGDGLVEVVRDAVHERIWVERNFTEPRRDEALLASWQEFKLAIQHETRYVFFLRSDQNEYEPGYVPTGRILEELGKLISDEGLVSEVPAGQQYWRARTHSEPNALWGARNLGTVPPDCAKYANRMSPAGIPLFYGSTDRDTAIHEVSVRLPSNHELVTVAAFETSHPCWVVDFTKLPILPSMFDTDNAHRRRPLIFLRQFVDDLKKIARPTWEQLDYVPTQVVTEYLLRIYDPGVYVSGLLYPSAHTGQPCVVLNVRDDRCVDQKEGWREKEGFYLGIIQESIQTQHCPKPSDML